MLISGVSGAGKSTALDTLSDSGFFVIDNLPIPLFEDFVALSKLHPARYLRTALLLDIDSQSKLEQLLELFNTLKRPPHLKLLFLDASNETLIKRYSETRRPHPGFDPSTDKTISDAIQREKNHLSRLRETASVVFDTSAMTVHDLRREIRQFIDTLSLEKSSVARVNFVSFGFKYGIPLDCDLVVDVRFLPNPHFVPELKDKTGIESEVAKYVLESAPAREFISKYLELLDFLLPQYAFEGKSYLNIGIGCTGGKHRSVAIAQKLYESIAPKEYFLSIKHRDISK